MPPHNCRPIVATLYADTSVTQGQVTLRIGFGTETLRFQLLLQLQFLFIRRAGQVIRVVVIYPTGIFHQAKVGSSHVGIVSLFAVGCTRKGHHGILHRDELPFAVGMTP